MTVLKNVCFSQLSPDSPVGAQAINYSLLYCSIPVIRSLGSSINLLYSMYTALSIDSTLLLSSIFIQNQHQEWFSQHRSIDHPTMYSMVNNSLARYASWPPYSPLELLTHQSIYDSFPFQTPILQTIFHLPPTRSALHTNESIYLSSFSTPFLNIIQCSEELYISICILFFFFCDLVVEEECYYILLDFLYRLDHEFIPFSV